MKPDGLHFLGFEGIGYHGVPAGKGFVIGCRPTTNVSDYSAIISQRPKILNNIATDKSRIGILISQWFWVRVPKLWVVGFFVSATCHYRRDIYRST